MTSKNKELVETELAKDSKEKVMIIKKKDETFLLNFINDIPTRYGLPLLKFVQSLEVI
jgi:hypothetical protein